MIENKPSVEQSSEKSVEKNEKQLAEAFELPDSLEGLNDADELPDEIDVEEISPKSTVEIGGERYKTDDNGRPYQKYDSKNNIWQLMPNEQYILNGYIYHTDDDSRIISAEGKIKIKDGEEGRKAINADLQDKKPTDQRGHLIGDKFNGDNGIGNLVPMDAKLNDGEFKKLENQLKEAAKAGYDVYFKVEPQYNDNSKRPDSFKVTYTIDGEIREKVFLNQSNQEGQL